MKKIIILLFAVFATLFTTAQTFNKVTECRMEKYQDNRWVVVERSYPETMFVIIKDKNIKITNKEDSEYEVYGDPNVSKYDSHYAYAWSAVNKDAKTCHVMIKTSLEDSKMLEIAIFMDETVYAYSFVRKKK
jgi:chloramphenicol O-acetyltransferase